MVRKGRLPKAEFVHFWLACGAVEITKA
jgi:hypothetical protein